MATLYRIELFGGLRLYGPDGTPIPMRSIKAAQLLSYLAYHSGRDLPRELLAEIVWPEADPDTGRARLRTMAQMSRTRAATQLARGSAANGVMKERCQVRLGRNLCAFFPRLSKSCLDDLGRR